MRTILIILIATPFIASVLMAPSLLRLAQRRGLEPSRLAWVPVANTLFIPRLAYASPFAWLLLFTPVSLYVWWDWWDEIAFEYGRPRPSLFAVGMLVPLLNVVLLARFVNTVAPPRPAAAPA